MPDSETVARVLVVYYSRTGMTRQVASCLAERLGADVEELVDTKNRSGAIGFVVAGKDAAMKKLVPIEPPKKNPADYDVVILGTPVWANTMASAMRAYLNEFGPTLPACALFATTAKSGLGATCDAMADLITAPVVAQAGFLQKQIKTDEHHTACTAFYKEIQHGLSEMPT
jgi:flavodoxin